MSTAASHGQCLAKVSLGHPLPSSAHRKLTFGKKRISLRRRVVLHHVLQVQSKAGFGRGTVKIKEEEDIDVEAESEPSTGTKKFLKLPGTIKLPGPAKSQAKGQSQAKSNKVVFVAGATGKVGSRTVRELLKLGFQVRAGTRNTEKAKALFEDVTQSGPAATGSNDATPFGFFSPAKLFGFLKPKSGKVLEFVECDLEDVASIESALGNAGTIVCCIGASEKEVLDVSGPYRIDFKATANLVDAASSAQVDHFVLVTSLGTQKFGFPAAVLNLFWGVLVWKAKAEKALLQSGLPYTIVRPGGMERPTDAYKETHNLILSEADKLFGGQVSNLQVAELLASIVENPEVSVNKIIEAIAETTAPLRPIRELLEEIPAKDGTGSSTKPQKSRPAKADIAPPKASKRQEEEKLTEEKRTLALKEKEEKRIQAEKLAKEKLAKAEKEKEEKRIRSENDEKEKLRLQALRKKYEQEIDAAREKEEAANSAAAAALAEKAELEKRAAEVRAKAEAAALAASQAKAVEAAVLAAARERNVLSDAEKEKIMKSVKLARLPKQDTPKEVKKPSPKKKPAFSFFGKAAPSTEDDTDVESESKEDQAKIDAEPKAQAKAEKEADTKLAGKKKQEEKARKEEEAKKLAEQETAKALEAKKKAEQDTVEKEDKEKAEKEASEAKKKEEAEFKRKQEAAEAKKKEEADAKKKKELAEAERLKVEAEEKAKAEQEADAKRKEEELAEAKKKEEQEKAEKEAEGLKVEAEEKPKALAEQAATAAATAAAEAEKEEEGLKKEEEAPAPPRGKGFRWFWQPAEPDTVEEEQTTKANVTEQAKVTKQAKATEQLPPSSTPLSPYARYPGLKPPCPPLASTSTAKVDIPEVDKVDTPKVDKVDTPKVDLVSPTINKVEQIKEEVEVLPEKGKEVVKEEVSPESQEDIEARAQQALETAAREKEALEKAEAAVSLKWLWEKTDPVEETFTSTSSKKEDPVSSSKEKEPASLATSKSDDLPRSSRPLSPYAQFPNLKPPAPPLPSPPASSNVVEEVKEAEPLPNSSTPLSPYPGFPDLKPPPSPTPLYNEAGNGAVPENAEETQQVKAESTLSSDFKWPWQG